MFSKAELLLIKECVETVKQLLQTHLEGKFFTEVEKCKKREEVEMIEDIVSIIEEADRDFVSLDADMLGELFTILKAFKEYMEQQAKDGNVACLEYGETMCRIGYLEAKIYEGGLLTNTEYEEILGILDTLDE